MRKALLLASLILAAGTLGLANDDDHSKTNASTGSTTLTGCLSGPNDEGVYVLKTKTSEVEVGGLADLKSHVGHEVKLTGTWTSESDIRDSGKKMEPEKMEHQHEGATPSHEKGEK